jgi:hypothetical protein
MEAKLYEVLNANEAVKKMANLQLSSKSAYHLARMGRKFIVEVKTYEERRMELIKKFGEEAIERTSKCCRAVLAKSILEGSENKEICSKCNKEAEVVETKKVGYFVVKPENMEEYNKDISAIIEESIDIDVVPMTLDMLGDVKITARELDAMGIFIIDTPKVPDNVVPIRRTNEI